MSMKTYHSFFLVVIALAVCAVPATAQKGAVGALTALPGSQAAINQTSHVLSVGLGNSVAKKVLNARASYLAEMRDVSQLYKCIQTSTNKALLQEDIKATIVNNTLRHALLTHLEKGNTTLMLQELADYYHLSPKYIPVFTFSLTPADTFVEDALNYLHNHPHKPNWALRTVLKSIGVDDGLKQQIRNVIKQDQLSPAQLEEAKSFLHLAYQQYMLSLQKASMDPSVTETVSIYKQLANDLEVFTAANNRAPLWENEKERMLYNRIETLLYFQHTNYFEQVTPYIEKLFTLVERFPTARFSEEESLKEVTRFFTKYGRLPLSVRLRDFSNPLPSEAMLYETMTYWQHNSLTFNENLGKLTHPANYYPTYY